MNFGTVPGFGHQLHQRLEEVDLEAILSSTEAVALVAHQPSHHDQFFCST